MIKEAHKSAPSIFASKKFLFMSISQNLTEDQTCPSVAYQMSSVCVPVTVTPYAKTGLTVTKCCGNAVVSPGMALCNGVKNGSCVFTISQNICVAVPVEFGATAQVGDAYVNCNGATAEDICTDCAQAPVQPAVPDTTVTGG